jgi:WD40 repeat protein
MIPCPSANAAAQGKIMADVGSGLFINHSKSSFEGAMIGIFRATYSPDGKYVAFLGSSAHNISQIQISIFDAKTWSLIKSIPFAESGLSVSEAGLSFSHDSHYLAFGITKVSILRVSDWSISQNIIGPYARGDYAAGLVQALTFSPDGRKIVILYSSAFWPLTVEVRNPKEASDLEQAALLSIRASKTPEFTRQAVIMAFDTRTGEPVFSNRLSAGTGNSDTVLASSAILYSPDGSKLISAGKSFKHMGPGNIPETDIFATLYNGTSGAYIGSIHNMHTDVITALAVSSEGKYFFTGTNSGEYASVYDPHLKSLKNIEVMDGIRKWDINSGHQIAEIGPVFGPVKALKINRENKIGIYCNNNLKSRDIVTTFDILSGEKIKSYGIDHDVRGRFMSCAISPDGKIVVVPELRQTLGGGMKSDEINIIRLGDK